MKTIGLLLLTGLYSITTYGQTWTTYNYTTEKFPFSVNFPSNPTKKIEAGSKDTMITLTSTHAGTTYALIATRTKSEAVATKASAQATDKILAKAKKTDAKQNGNIAGKNSTYSKYVTAKDAYVINHSFSDGRFLYKAMVLRMNNYADDANAQTFFNSIVLNSSNSNLSNNSITPVNTNTNTTSNNATNNNNANVTETWVVNDRVEVFDAKENKWYGAVIQKINSNGTFRVSFDGYAENYDEDATADRIRKMTTGTTPSNVQYIKTVKGQTVKVEGNLKNGSKLEDLEWAESSSMACWPGIRNVEFEGNQVGYWIDLPKKSIVKITVTPKSTNTRINIYGYSGFDLKKTPPEVSRCTSCEASHPTWIGEPNLNEPAQPQTIEFNATTIRNMVYIAVSGARNVTSGDYTLTIELK